jgi:hypothetical protein
MDQHTPAWWELYTHRLFSCLGYDVDVHPELDDRPGTPDFLISRGSWSAYVESTTVFTGGDIKNADGRAWV